MDKISNSCIKFFKEIEPSMEEYCNKLKYKMESYEEPYNIEEIASDLNGVSPYIYNTNTPIEVLEEFSNVINDLIEILTDEYCGSLNIKFGKNELLKKNYFKLKFIFTTN